MNIQIQNGARGEMGSAVLEKSNHFNSENRNLDNDMDSDSVNDVFYNPNYLNQLSELMENISDKGATVAQLKDGTIFVSETRIIVYKYVWDKEKCVFVKQRSRSARNSSRERFSNSASNEVDDSQEDMINDNE